MSWNDEDWVRELQGELAQLRAGMNALADEMEECQYELAGAYAGQLRALAADDDEEEDD